MWRIIGGIIKNILLLPLPLRIVVELAIAVILAALIWMLFKWIPAFLLKILGGLNELVTLINRQLLCVFEKKSSKVYDWDEKIAIAGRKIDLCLHNAVAWVKKLNAGQILKSKKSICVLIVIYFLAILPSIPLKYILDEYYLEHLYGINRMFTRVENWADEKFEGYPPLINYQRRAGNDDSETLEEPYVEVVKIYTILQLDSDTAYANIRETPEMDGSKVGLVSREDTIVYQNEFSYDNERYWLKVVVESQNNMEGWISANIIESSIVDELNLE